jgi:adenylosuccinate lyase
MIPRYSRPEMARIWEPENKYAVWLKVEILACEAWAALGEVPRAALARIKKRVRFDVARIDAIEREVKHDVIAFLTAVGESIGPAARYLHLGMTSSDVLDTALAVQLREAADLLIRDLDQVRAVVKRQALRHKRTPMIGRTHGVHAEPIAFGLKLALWHEELGRHRERLLRARDVVSVGKVSGAVGTYANGDPRVEAYVCRKLGLKPASVSSQILQRDRHAEFVSTLALLASSLEKFAVELRHLQRTEVLEAEEYFSSGQKGSSAMPHKRNPISAENLSGLARLARSYSLAAMENVPLWHERDISHSSVERVILPDAAILLDYMLNRFADLIEHLIVYPANMRANLLKLGGLIHSEGVLLALVKKGLAREKAYQLVQRNAMAVWQEGGDFGKRLKADREVARHLTPQEIDDCLDLRHALRHVDGIFKRVFGRRTR